MKKIFPYIIIALIFTVQVVHAQNNYTLLEPLPNINGITQDKQCLSGNTLTCISFDTYIEYVFKFSIALAVFLAIVMIIWGGFEYMTSESPFGKSDGKSRITNAIIGLLGALVSYLILLTIDPRLVQINSRIDPVEIKTSDVTAFQNRFANEIKILNMEDIKNIKELQSKNDEAKLSIDALEKLKNSSGLSPEDERRLAALKLDYKSRDAEILRTTAKGIGNNGFSTILDYTNTASNYTATFSGKDATLKPEVNEKIQGGLSLIKEKYLGPGGYVEQLKNDGDLEGAKKLEGRVEYYVEQTKEQEDIMHEIFLYQTADSKTKQQYRDRLQYSLDVYSKPEIVPENFHTSDPVLLKEYEELKAKRVDMIKKVLNPSQTSK